MTENNGNEDWEDILTFCQSIFVMHVISHICTKINGGVRFPPFGPHGWVTTGFKQNTGCGYSLEKIHFSIRLLKIDRT